jgi:hypothetical protein
MQQPTLSDFLKQNPNQTEKDYSTRFIGRYKNHHRKIKRMFHSLKTTKFKNNQVDFEFGRVIISGRF